MPDKRSALGGHPD